VPSSDAVRMAAAHAARAGGVGRKHCHPLLRFDEDMWLERHPYLGVKVNAGRMGTKEAVPEALGKGVVRGRRQGAGFQLLNWVSYDCRKYHACCRFPMGAPFPSSDRGASSLSKVGLSCISRCPR
jgi:hypothetical protein